MLSIVYVIIDKHGYKRKNGFADFSLSSVLKIKLGHK